jgi:hypothetical protein
MARRTHMTMQKRQRELRRAEKAARKRAKRHGHALETHTEPTPTVDVTDLVGSKPSVDDETPQRSDDAEPDRKEDDET